MPNKQGKILLWKNFFKDPLQWLDNRGTKKNSRSPDFKHSTENKSLWIYEYKLPLWVHEELNRRDFLIDKLERECVKKNRKEKEDFPYVILLKICVKNKDLCSGIRLHDDILQKGLLEKNPYLASALVNMYAKCGSLSKAQSLLEELPSRDLVTWSALIAGYAKDGKSIEALNCFERMQTEGITPDSITFICVLKACGDTRSIDKGKQIHEDIVSRGLLEKKDILLGTALVYMYAKWGFLEKALELLEELPFRDIISWNTLISGYIQQGQGNEALNCFARMQREYLSPNVVTFICILKACGMTRDVHKGEELHGEIMRKGLVEKDVMLRNALVDMYARCGMLFKAQQVLEEAPLRNTVTWNAVIGGYAEKGQFQEALNCFRRMQGEGLTANEVTYICILKACGNVGALKKGQQIHTYIASNGLLKKDVVLGNALVDMYVKCGVVSKAQKVLDELPVRNVISWSAMIAGYTQQAQAHEALNCFESMQSEGFTPNPITLSSILKVCGSTGAVNRGEQIEKDIVNRGLLEKEIVLGNALVHMYAKCGMLGKAQRVLMQLQTRDTVSWNSLISGFAAQGRGLEALNCFKHMQRDRIVPNEVTFLCVLNACRRCGLSEEAQTLFWDMRSKYGISPNIEHFTSMVTILGYAGHFETAISIIRLMSSSDDLVVWLALLASCKKWANVKLSKLAFGQVVQIDDACASAYILIADIFASCGMEDDAKKVEAMNNETLNIEGNSPQVDSSVVRKLAD